MQLLFEKGEEDGPNTGLGLIKGNFSKNCYFFIFIFKIPIFSYNLYKTSFPMLNKVRTSADFYFVHSSECKIENNLNLIASRKFCSIN